MHGYTCNLPALRTVLVFQLVTYSIASFPGTEERKKERLVHTVYACT